MNRTPHRLRRNHRNASLTHLITVDTEAIISGAGPLDQTHTLRCGVAQYWSPARRRQKERMRYLEFTDAADFWSWAIAQLPKRSSAVVIAHNAAYDARLLDMFRVLPALGFAARKLVLDDPPFIAEWSERCQSCDQQPDKHGVVGETKRVPGCTAGHHRSLRVWSTTNIVAAPLAELARSVGLPKALMPSSSAPIPEWFAYCRRDVDALALWYRGYVRFVQDNDLGNLSPTIAGQAWHAFTHRFMAVPVLLHDNSDVLALERSGYFGGRCECFRLGDLSGEDWTHLDVNALYPYVMSRTFVPTQLVTTRKRPDVALVTRLLSTYCVVARCRISTEKALFPVRYRSSLCFPVGDFETTLQTPELQLALQRGAVRSISYCAVYDRGLIFDRYVAALWHLRSAARAKGDRIGDRIAKDLANSLYGKFSQQRQRWLDIDTCDPSDAGVLDEYDWTQHRHRTIRWVGGPVQEKQRPDEGSESFPAIAAHITSAGRVEMAQLLERLERFDCAYMDTDSLIVNAHGRAALADRIAPDQLGGLKVKREAPDLYVGGPKWYYHGTDVVTKGVRIDAEWYDKHTISQWHWHGMAWSIAQNTIDRVKLERVKKDFRFTYGKGTVDEDGRIFPLQLDFG